MLNFTMPRLAKKNRKSCTECGSTNTYIKKVGKSLTYVYCNHCGHSECS